MSEGLGDRKKRRPGLYSGKALTAVDGDEEQNWLITFSDLLSLLLIFFIVLVAVSRVSPPGKKPQVPTLQTASGASSPAPTPSLVALERELKTAVGALDLGDQVIVQSRPQEVLITLKEAVTFPSGEAEILENSRPILAAVADVIRRHPTFQVEIEGHTDDRPIRTGRFPSNWELSVARAAGVLTYLIEGQGLDPSRFSIKGYGEQRPAVPNLNEELRAQNRRVEIRLKNRSQESAGKTSFSYPEMITPTAQESRISRTL